VCGERKANEKFSGKGHAAHICKKCAALPVAERNEQMTLRRIDGMAFRHLSKADIKWLRGKMGDPRPDVRGAARGVHGFKFPYYERNMIKKGLTARSLEFYIRGNVWDEYGDFISVHMSFFADSSGVLRCIDYSAPEEDQEMAINIGQPAALKFLKAVVHQFNAPFWSEDLSDAGPDEYDPCDPCLDVLPEFRPDFGYGEDSGLDEEVGDCECGGTGGVAGGHDAIAEVREPIWSLRLMLTKGIGETSQAFYNQMHDEPQELFWSLMEWFVPGIDDFEVDDDE